MPAARIVGFMVGWALLGVFCFSMALYTAPAAHAQEARVSIVANTAAVLCKTEQEINLVALAQRQGIAQAKAVNTINHKLPATCYQATVKTIWGVPPRRRYLLQGRIYEVRLTAVGAYSLKRGNYTEYRYGLMLAPMQHI